jgi:hypothetical protein
LRQSPTWRREAPNVIAAVQRYDAIGNPALWVSDRTAAGTHEVTGISNAHGGGNGVFPSYITSFNGGALFAGEDEDIVATQFAQLWNQR